MRNIDRIKSIQLSDCPDLLQQAAQKEIADNHYAKLLDCRFHESTPFKDKSITFYSYKAYLEMGNLMLLLKMEKCPGMSYMDDKVNQQYMTIGDVAVFADNSALCAFPLSH